jgi:hypothetical protein
MKYNFKWQNFNDSYYLLLQNSDCILAKVWFDEHDKRTVKGWYFVDENGNARKDEDLNYECYSSLDEAKYQATSWVIDLLNKPKQSKESK